MTPVFLIKPFQAWLCAKIEHSWCIILSQLKKPAANSLLLIFGKHKQTAFFRHRLLRGRKEWVNGYNRPSKQSWLIKTSHEQKKAKEPRRIIIFHTSINILSLPLKKSHLIALP